jgi:histidine triad (HIT) family protein
VGTTPYDQALSVCMFCAIAAGEIPAAIVGETSDTVAFRDIAPQAPVHVLVITRVHYIDVDDLTAADPDLAGRFLADVAAVATAEGLTESGYRIVLNTGVDGGQSVGHVHAHILGGRGLAWPPG